ncbi:sensor domain-containing protein [Alkalicoccus luteus]|uniref:Diguanylate cyclase n=1 Tax=Alkalicoccus luteus TaxID=1237094 RepID=A0A969PSG3_9BACI|nr:diguanylate cyclase [Alkalicoccus luteus]NJP38533.1 diguanylate cyclase [Alkalicoccus luteus]
MGISDYKSALELFSAPAVFLKRTGNAERGFLLEAANTPFTSLISENADVQLSELERFMDSTNKELFHQMCSYVWSSQTSSSFKLMVKGRFFMVYISMVQAGLSLLFTDITSVQSRLDTLETYVANSPALMCRMDESGMILEVNAEWEVLIGVSSGMLVGRSMLDLVLEEDREPSKKAFMRAFRGETIRHFLNRIVTAAGTIHYLEWHLSISGRMVLASAVDATDRELHHREAVKRGKLLENLTEEVPGGLYQLKRDENGTISFPYYSKGFLDIFQVGETELKQDESVVFSKVVGEDQDKALQSMLESAETMSRWVLEFRIKDEDDNVRWIRGRSQPAAYRYGAVIWYGHVYDITEEKNRELALKESEEKMRLLTTQVPGMLYQFDVSRDGDFSFSAASEGVNSLTGFTQEQVCRDAACLLQNIEAPDLERVERSINAAVKDQSLWSLEYWYHHPEKGRRRLRGNAQPRKLSGGTVRFYGYIYDITEAIQKEEKLEERERLITQISDRIPGIIYQMTGTGPDDLRFTMAAGQMETLLGMNFNEKELQQYPIMDLVYKQDREDLQKVIDASVEHLTLFDCTFRIHVGEAKLKWVRATSTPERLQDGRILWSGYLNDVTKAKHSEFALLESESRFKKLAAEMQDMAYHDPLTGLPNRRMLFQQLELEMERSDMTGSSIGLLFIDLDDFKAINDTYGHDAGDLLLKEIAMRLQNSVRQSDLAARMAGDEFLILFTGLTAEHDLRSAVENVMDAIGAPFHVHDQMMTCSASVGAASYPEHGRTADELISCADKAMYQQKRAEKNGFLVYEKGMEFL